MATYKVIVTYPSGKQDECYNSASLGRVGAEFTSIKLAQEAADRLKQEFPNNSYIVVQT